MPLLLLIPPLSPSPGPPRGLRAAFSLPKASPLGPPLTPRASSGSPQHIIHLELELGAARAPGLKPELWGLPPGPGAVFTEHRVGRRLEACGAYHHFVLTVFRLHSGAMAGEPKNTGATEVRSPVFCTHRLPYLGFTPSRLKGLIAPVLV